MANTGPTRSLVFEEESVETSRNVHITPDGRHVKGPGSLDTLLIVADGKDFGLRAETATTTLVNDDFEKLSKWSSDLEHVDAYTNNNGKHAISLSNFPFRESVTATVLVESSLTIEWIRAVYTLGREVDY